MAVYIDIIIDQAMTISFFHSLYFIKCKMSLLTIMILDKSKKLVRPILVNSRLRDYVSNYSAEANNRTFPQYYKINYL